MPIDANQPPLTNEHNRKQPPFIAFINVITLFNYVLRWGYPLFCNFSTSPIIPSDVEELAARHVQKDFRRSQSSQPHAAKQRW